MPVPNISLYRVMDAAILEEGIYFDSKHVAPADTDGNSVVLNGIVGP